MRCFLLIFSLLLSGVGLAEEQEKSVYALNKEALERAVKIYLAYEARHDVEPNVGADLQLPDKAKFRMKKGAEFDEWIYPIALGLEIKIEEEQRRIVIMAPRACYGWYLIGTDDLTVKGYRGAQIQKIFDALDARRAKLAESPLD
ncbi:hypothetical protein ACFPK9_03155 [Rubritalea spongiae]|uniref:Uncharacterized protein n=1 Tax=Rubritalea spongiae TaxID=430797 RepID=A0ABW5E6Y8_9BACT